MKKADRVRRNTDFEKIIKEKKSFSNDTFVVYYLQNELNRLRIGISVGKKIGNAVERNKVKRQIRMILMETCDFSQPYDIIVIIRRKFRERTYLENKNNLLPILKKVKIMKIIS